MNFIINTVKAIIITSVVIICSFSAFAESLSFSKIQNLNMLNSSKNEFAPYFHSGTLTLFFCSDSTGVSRIYTAKLNSDNNFEQPQLFRADFNTKNNDNKSYITFLGDDHAYINYFYLFPERSYLNIQQTFFRKKTWTAPVPVEELKGQCFSGQQTISPDGSFMIFSSDRDNKYDADLFIAYKKADGTWDNIMSLSKLNSAGNEITPFLLSADTLIFATNGYEGQGGYDLYCSIFQDGEWTRPFPLDGLNSTFDESDCIIVNNMAIFASNRPGGSGNLDLYSAQIQKEQNITKQEPKEFSAELNSSASLIKLNSNEKYFYAMMSASAYLEDSTIIAMFAKGELNNQDFSVLSNQYYRALSAYTFLQRFSSLADSSHLYITISHSTAKDKISFLLKLINDIFNIKNERIILKESDLKDNQFVLSAEQEDIYSPFQVNNIEYDILPQTIDIELITRPEGYTKSINYFTETDCYSCPNNKMHLLKQFQNRNNININLLNLSNQLASSSVLSIIAKGIDSNSDNFDKKIELNISSNSSSEKSLISSNSKQYEILLIPTDFNSQYNQKQFDAFKAYLKSIYRPGKTIMISYSGSSDIPEQLKAHLSFCNKRSLTTIPYENSILPPMIKSDTNLLFLLVEK